MLCSGVKFLAVPSDKTLNVFFHLSGGLVVKLLDQVGHVSIGVWHITGLQGQQLFFGCFAEDFFGGGKRGEEGNDSSKTDDFRQSPGQH